ncbi:Girdin [Caenorhabditis elegans]|uniref:Girdin n=2 Tax=Caenorhabditis elegans TaxID=6239 RepID=A0A3P6PCW4_CAEEL|nr:Girdin [Caenorhabditis elegans]VDJ66040.1 Girdin [Caenorhabditis elegans]|eukprot:NP_001355535.1 Uncharacterized protein CELE_C34E11.3 [Caenorhabditis elegans]
MSDLCNGFEPQNYLKERCKKCFRPKDKHVEEATVTLSTLKKERRRSWKPASNLDNGANDDDDTEALSVSSYLSATSKGMSSTKSCESVNDTKSMVTAFSGSICEEERAITPTENESEYIQTLKEEISQLRDINHSLKEEKAQWALRQRLQNAEQSESSLINMLEDRLNQAENQIQDYRDENTVLKCELRELQETTFATSDEKLREKIRTTEGLCDELMEENEQLKAEVKDLQQEIEEMQDQYREEEIEEFRELQRELELNAKNCRVLQFKLRKTERSRDQAEAEKMHSEKKLDEYMNSCPEAVAASIKSDSAKVKELEYEIRVAKEVSVRLHNELEQTEEKRCKLEDEVFYLKEKVREIQTQNKWREARNKTDIAVKRLSAEIAASVPNIPENEMSKELRDALEREIDLREQMRFSEEDLKRTQIRLQDVENENEELLKKLSKASKLRPPMIRSASDGNAHLQLELAESQVQHLNTKIERLEKTNDHLNKKIVELEADCKRGGVTSAHSKAGEFKLTPEMEKDMSKMIVTISELERKNLELTTQVKQLETKVTPKPNFVVPSGTTTTELRKEQEKRKALEAQVNELKTTVFKSDNQKVISLATKIEQLNGQLQMVNERCNTLHKKQVKDGEIQYSDELKQKIEDLEKRLSEKLAIDSVSELQGKIPTIDEIEQCCEVLAAVETQTGRLCKQFEKIDHAQKDERRRSLSKDSGAAIIAELANVMQEMKNVHQKLDKIKNVTPNTGLSVKRIPSKENLLEIKCSKCDQLQTSIDEQANEISFYKKKNKDLTNQVLQTEDRWTIEIEKQRQIFEKEIKTLGIRVADAKRQNDELSELLESKSTTLVEKTRSLEEQEERSKKLRAETELLRKDMQELETDKKTVKEFEIKYKKLESIFETEREKMNGERNRSKNELAAMKKLKDDAEEHLKKLSDDQKKNDAAWKIEKSKLEKDIALLKKQLPDEHEMKESTATPQNSISGESSPLRRQDSEKMLVLELKKQISILEKRIADSNSSLEECKIQNAELRDQLAKVQANWEKDKEVFQHKTRKSEKLRTVEIDAMQQKFSSRMRIMEDTNKALHSQLVLARRERDTNKDALTNFEKQVTDERNNLKVKEKSANESTEKVKELQNRLTAKEEELERLNTDLRLTKEARKADQILWNIDRARNRNEKIDNTDSVETIRKQYRDCETFYSKEMDRLNDKITEITAEKNRQKNEAQKTIRVLSEQIKVLEIEQKNLSQNKDSQQVVKEMIESERERLQQIVHLNELQKLTRKYRLSSIIDQLAYVSEATRKTSREAEPDGIRYIINQLTVLRDDEAANNLNPDERAGSVLGEKASNGYAPSISECGEGTYDNISQSSFSIRSVNSAPLRHAYRHANLPIPTTTASVSTTISETEPYYSKPEKLNIISNYTTKRSFSTESSNGFDKYGRPMRRGLYHEPSSSNNLSVPGRKTSNDEYSMSRAASFDNRSQFSEDEVTEDGRSSRPNSTGANILYRVRREELARGGQPSVKLMAKAFEAIDEPRTDKRGFFGIRKSRSVETTQNGKHSKFEEAANSALMHSLGQVEEGVSSNYATLPRGGRNPFKNMGSRLVERVRRSLSRSSRQSRDSDREDEIEVQVYKKPEKPISSPKKTKKKSAESKARKNSSNIFT